MESAEPVDGFLWPAIGFARYKNIVKSRWFWIVFAVIVACGLLGNWWWKDHRENRFDKLIHDAARQYDVEPALVKAVIWRESRFNPRAKGKVGEIGLMQIRELAAKEWAEAERISLFVHQQLFDPGMNIRAGTWYLKHVSKRYRKADDPTPYALADFNAGRSNVLKWLNGAAATNSAVFIEQIGFPGTKRYVESVMQRREQYRGEEGE